MQEDIAALKKGGAPAGFQIEKQFEKDQKISVQSSILKPAPTFQTPSHMELGKLEKSKPLASGPSLPFLPPSAPSKVSGLQPLGSGSPKPSIGLPSAPSLLGRLNSRKLIWGGVGLLVIVALAIFFFVLRPTAPEVVFTPTPTATPIPVASTGIEGSFSVFSRVNLDVESADVFDDLLINIDEDVLAGGELGLYQIVDPQSNLGYSFSSFMSGALVTIPEEIIPFVDNDNFYLSLVQKTDGSYGRGFIVKLKNEAGISEALSRWEANMPANLKTIFALNIEQAASVNFLDNTYQGATVRYKNFPDTLKTIDYAVVTAVDGSKYLVVTSSRDHIYLIIDKIR